MAAAAGSASCSTNMGHYFCNTGRLAQGKLLDSGSQRQRHLFPWSLVPAQEPAGQVSPTSTPCPCPCVGPAPESLPLKVSSRKNSPPASPPLLQKRRFTGPKVTESKPQSAALALLLSAASQSQHPFTGASKQANVRLKANTGASAHRVTWEKETRAGSYL